MLHLTPPEDFSPRYHVASCFVECEGKILLLLRQRNKDRGNTWGVPAGKIDAGETPTQSIQRELQEETGITIPQNNFEHQQTVYVRYPDYDFVYHIFHVRIKEKPDVFLRPTEHQAHQWRTPQDARTLPLVPDQDACIALVYPQSV